MNKIRLGSDTCAVRIFCSESFFKLEDEINDFIDRPNPEEREYFVIHDIKIFSEGENIIGIVVFGFTDEGDDVQQSQGGAKVMATLRQEAMAYEPPQTLNIADLQKVPVEVLLFEKESKDSEGKPFKYKYFELDGKEYRVPNSVLEEIKKMLKLKPTIEFVHVKKSGSGLGTRYEVEEAP